MARWQATFTWLPINGIMRIDGVMQVTFSERRDGRLLGLEFNDGSIKSKSEQIEAVPGVSGTALRCMPERGDCSLALRLACGAAGFAASFLGFFASLPGKDFSLAIVVARKENEVLHPRTRDASALDFHAEIAADSRGFLIVFHTERETARTGNGQGGRRASSPGFWTRRMSRSEAPALGHRRSTTRASTIGS